MRLFRTILALSLIWAIFPSTASPEENLDAASQLAYLSDQSDVGFSSSFANAQMILRDADGNESERSIEVRTLERSSDEFGDKTIIYFSKPKDIRGTILLSHANIEEPDQQWLYLPSIKRTKRISSANKSGAFVGSEFSFEDMTAQEYKKYTYALIRNETLDEVGHTVIERIPTYEKSGYSRQVVWVNNETKQFSRIEYFSRADELLKTLEMKEYVQFPNGAWRPLVLDMMNVQTGKSTTLKYSDYQFNLGYTELNFDKNALKNL
jgi:outer membrane lipoprotein-sorting protein